MDDVIYRQDAVDALKLKGFPYLFGMTDKDRAIEEAVKNVPPVDAVEVVRCGECKHASPNGKYGCKSYHYRLYECHEMGADDFCSYGERKTDG